MDKAEGDSMKTESELLFEDYLRNNGYLDFEFEPPVHGKKKHPDYLVRRNGQELFFEVKQREAPKHSPRFAWFNPYSGIRSDIEKAREKFREFKDYCCSVVIANRGDPNTLLDAEFIFGAMLGDLGFTFPILDTDDRHRFDTIQNVFLRRSGKMVHSYKSGEYHNTTIAAVIGLEEARLRNTEVERLQHQAIQEKQRQRGRELSLREQAVVVCGVAIEYAEAGRGPIYHRVPRVIVCENPGARVPLSRNVLCGPFDERWAIVDKGLSPVYAGVRVREIETPRIAEEVCSRSGT